MGDSGRALRVDHSGGDESSKERIF